MSEYNAKNYTEPGGDVTHIGGKLILEENCVGGCLIPNVTFNMDSDLEGLKSSYNTLLYRLKDSGLMVGDPLNASVNNGVKDTAEGDDARAFNILMIDDVAISDDVITITLKCPVEELKFFDAGEDGVNKWLGIGMSLGWNVSSIKYNGEFFTQAKKDEAAAMGLENLWFVLWVKAEKVIEGKCDTFTLWSYGHRETEYTLRIVEGENG